jgi:hypothetical protein
VAVAINRIRAVLKGFVAAVEADIDCLVGMGKTIKYQDCPSWMSLNMSGILIFKQQSPSP